MEVVSKLFKTQLKVIKIKREDDKLMLLGDPADPMSANSSMTAKDVGDMAGLAFSWDVLLWAILFPFYYVGTLLKDQDLDKKIFSGAYVIGNTLIALLLISSYKYLGTYPFLSALVFFAFAVAFFITFSVSDRYGFLYPAVMLAVVAYYGCLSGLGFPSLQFPVFALPLLVLIVGGGLYLEKHDKEGISNVFYWSGLTVVFYFLTAICYALYSTDDYLGTAGWVAVSSIIGFALYYGIRAWQAEREFLSYVALFFLTLAIVIELSVLHIPATTQGILLFHVGILYALAGTALQRTLAFVLARPYYVLGLAIPAVSLLSFYNLRAIFTYGLLVFAASSLMVSESITEEQRDDEDEPDRAYWFKKAYEYVGNASGYAALVLYCLSGFPVSMLITTAALFTAIAYLYSSIRSDGSFITQRNEYLYLFGIFTALFLYPLLWLANPLKTTGLNMAFSAIPIGILLYLGTLFARSNSEAKAATTYESISFFIFLGFALPLLTGEYSPGISLFITGVLIALVGTAYILGMYHQSLHYAPVLLLASVMFSLLYSVVPSYLVIGFAFILFGLTGMVLALKSYRRKSAWSNPLLFAWILGAVLSLSLFSGYKQLFMYGMAGWAVIFTLAALYIRRPAKEEIPTS